MLESQFGCINNVSFIIFIKHIFYARAFFDLHALHRGSSTFTPFTLQLAKGMQTWWGLRGTTGHLVGSWRPSTLRKPSVLCSSWFQVDNQSVLISNRRADCEETFASTWLFPSSSLYLKLLMKYCRLRRRRASWVQGSMSPWERLLGKLIADSTE